MDLLLNLNYRRSPDAPEQQGTDLIGSPAGGRSQWLVQQPPPGQTQQVETQQGQVVLHALGGARQDRLNRLLRRADSLLAEGRFYDAAATYDAAGRLAPANPLPAVGASLAQLGAGEFLRAGRTLGGALRVFPAQMEVRVDLQSMLGAETIDARADELREGLETGQVAATESTLFLMSYLAGNRGDQEQARRWARRLDERVEPGSVLQAYVDYVLTGRRPGDPAPQESAAGEPARP
jgi:hypothetical protein